MKKLLIATIVASSVFNCGFAQSQQIKQNTVTVPTSAVNSTSILRPSKLGGIAEIPFAEKYAIVIGAFRHKAYADKRVEYSAGLGYKAQIVSFKNGLFAVVICPTNDLEEALNNLNKLRGTRVCPNDSWILTNE